jgi:hypothetical protein
MFMGGSMRAVGWVGNAVLVGLLAVTGYSIVHGVRDAKAKPTPFGDNRPLVLGPTGLSKLRLGMSAKEADATGETLGTDDDSPSTAPCGSQQVNGVTIHISPKYGIVGLSGPLSRTRTPEGIGAGSTIADITKAYHTLSHPELGTAQEQVDLLGEFSTPVPGSKRAVYRFIFKTFQLKAGDSTAGPVPLRGDRRQVKYILLSLGDLDDCLTIS